MSETDCFPEFPIGLTVQLVSSDEYTAVLLTGGEDDHICRYSLIWLNLDELTHFDIFTEDGTFACFLNQGVLLVVGLVISFFPVDIIIGFFEDSKSEHEQQGRHVCK